MGRPHKKETNAGLLLIARATGWSRAEILSFPQSEFEEFLGLLAES